MTDIQISVQEQPFDQNAVYQWLSEQHSVGATVIFVGKVRDLNLGDEVSQAYTRTLSRDDRESLT